MAPPPQPKAASKSKAARKRKAEAAPSTQKAAKFAKSKAWEVERIVEESGAWGGHKRWFVVEWAHENYTPSWEAWRNAGGAAGTPVLTWMPLKKVRRLQAFQAWEAARATATASELACALREARARLREALGKAAPSQQLSVCQPHPASLSRR